MQNSNTELPFVEAKVKKRTKSSSPVKMQNEILKFKIFRHEKDYNPPTTLPPKRRAPTAEKFEEIYPKRKGSDSPGDFGFERTGKINFRTL